MLKRLYRIAIQMMPPEYRSSYGEEQWRLFEQVLAEEAPRNHTRRMVWSVDLLTRAFWASLQVRGDRWRAARRLQRGVTIGGGGSMKSDLRFTVRSMKTAPWYATAVIAVTAVTVALATTTFAIVDGVLFRPLPYPDSAALVSIEPSFAGVPPPVYRDRATFRGYSASEVDLANWQASVPEIQITAFRAQPWGGLGANRDETAGVAHVQPNFFDVIGVAPLIGGLTPDHYRANAKMKPVIISYDAWMARFDGDHRALGEEIITDLAGGGGVRIVGIMPKGFTFPSGRTDVTFIAPFVSDPKTRENPANRINRDEWHPRHLESA